MTRRGPQVGQEGPSGVRAAGEVHLDDAPPCGRVRCWEGASLGDAGISDDDGGGSQAGPYGVCGGAECREVGDVGLQGGCCGGAGSPRPPPTRPQRVPARRPGPRRAASPARAAPKPRATPVTTTVRLPSTLQCFIGRASSPARWQCCRPLRAARRRVRTRRVRSCVRSGGVVGVSGRTTGLLHFGLVQVVAALRQLPHRAGPEVLERRRRLRRSGTSSARE